MKRLICGLVLIALLCTAAMAEDAGVLEYYYANYCESCSPDQEFAAEFEAMSGQKIDAWVYLPYNVVTRAGQEAYREMLDRLGLQDEDNFPVAVVNGRAFVGSAALAAELPAFLVEQMDSTDSVVYYLRSDDESCAETDEWAADCPEAIEVTLGKYSFESCLRIVTLDVDEQAGEAERLLDAFGVPEAQRRAPVMLAGSGCWQGAEAIRIFLDFQLAKGAALGTPDPGK